MDAGKNLGLHHGFNHVLSKIGFNSSDDVIAFDADTFPLTDAWDRDLINLLREKDIGWASLMNPRSEREITPKRYKKRMVGDVEAWITPEPVVNSISAFRGDFLCATSGLHEKNDYYGHLEGVMWPLLKQLRLEWAFVVNQKESEHLRNEHDDDYTRFKWVIAHEGSWTSDMESWIKAGMPGGLNCPKILP